MSVFSELPVVLVLLIAFGLVLRLWFVRVFGPLTAAGTALWVAGYGVVVSRGLAGDTSYPHLGHLLWLFGLVLVLVGVFRAAARDPSPHNEYVGPQFALDVALVSSAWLLVLWRTVVWTPQFDTLATVPWSRLAALTVCVLVAVAITQLAADRLTLPMGLLAAGQILVVTGELLRLAALRDGHPAGDPALWCALAGGAVILLAVGLMRRYRRAVRHAVRIRGVMTMAMLVIPLCTFIVQMSGRTTDQLTGVLGALLVIVYSGREVYRFGQTRLLLRRLRHQAGYDPLTELRNRRSLTERLDELAQARRPFCVITVDVDRFKEVNRQLGHVVGDRVLVEVADVLREEANEVPFRIGGDEFAILTAMSEHEAEQHAERVRARVRRQVEQLPGVERLGVTLSMGIAGWDPEQSADPLETLTRSSQALRVAKLDRNQVRLYSDEDTRAFEAQTLLEDRLEQAVAQDAIEFRFQPILRLSDGRAVSVETLARWHDEVLGDVPAARFITAAERTGLIHELGRACLRAAVTLAARLDAEHRPMPVAVNISPVQLRRHTFEDEVTGLLEERGLAPDLLRVEVTEGVFIDLDDPAVATLDRLSARGIGIAIDDFGTGYSSLGYITRLPIDLIKVDRSLTSRVGEPRTRSIIAAVLGVARAHELDVVLEGVDNPTDARRLRDLGVEYGQGFLWSRALTAAQLLDWLAGNPPDGVATAGQVDPEAGRTTS